MYHKIFLNANSRPSQSKNSKVGLAKERHWLYSIPLKKTVTVRPQRDLEKMTNSSETVLDDQGKPNINTFGKSRSSFLKPDHIDTQPLQDKEYTFKGTSKNQDPFGSARNPARAIGCAIRDTTNQTRIWEFMRGHGAKSTFACSNLESRTLVVGAKGCEHGVTQQSWKRMVFRGSHHFVSSPSLDGGE